MQALHIFISSPGYVNEERESVKNAVQILRREHAKNTSR